MKYKIAIFGLGNIGKRHLQSLAFSKISMDILLFDINKNNLLSAIQIWEDERSLYRSKVEINIKIVSEYSELPKILDLVIIATSAKI